MKCKSQLGFNGLTLSDTKVRSSVTLQFKIFFLSFPSTNKLRLEFSGTRSRFATATPTWSYSTATCDELTTPGGTFTCSYSSASNQLTMTPSGSISSCTIQINIASYVNNDYTQDETVNAVQLDASSGSVTTTSFTLSYTPLSFTSMSMTPQSLVVAATAALQVSFVPGTIDLSSSFTMVFTFPARYSTSSAYFSAGSYSCTRVTTNIEASPTCTVTTSSGVSTVTVTNIFSSTITSTDPVTFQIPNMLNPISTDTVSSISAVITDPSSTSYIYFQTTSASMAVTTGKTASTFSLAFSSGQLGINQVATTNYLVIETLPGVLMNANCVGTIRIPSEVTFVSANLQSNIFTGWSYSSATRTMTSTGCNAVTNTGSTKSSTYIRIQGPAQVMTTSNFELTIVSSSGGSIATSTATLASTNFSPGTTSSMSFGYVTGQSQIVQKSTQWKFGITTANALTNPWKIIITVPSTVTISACSPSSLTGFSGTPTCAFSGTTITLTGTFAQAAGAVTMEGISGTNPISIAPTGTFTCNTYNTIGTDLLVDQTGSFSALFTATKQSLTSITVSIPTPATNSITGKPGVTYEFTVVHQSTFPDNSIIVLTAPVSGCLTMKDSGGTTQTSITFTSKITSQLLSTSNLVFTHEGFTNPRSTNNACGSFTMVIQDASGFTIEDGSGGSVTVANANTLPNFAITSTTPAALINGGTSSYTISSTAHADTALVSGDRYYITFPSDITFSSPTCDTITCTLEGSAITFTIPATVPSPVTNVINNIIVQGDMQPITTVISVSVVTSSSTSQVISTHSTETVPTTTVAGTLTSATLTQTSNVASTAGQYTFTFTTANKIPVGGVVLIRNNPGLTFSLTGTCTTASGYFGVCSFESSSNGVVVPVATEIPKSTSVSIQIGDYTNPALPTTSSFIIDTYKTSTKTYKIDNLSTGLVPSLEWDYPCKTCSGTRTACTSCFSSISEKYYYAHNNSCASSCATGYYQDDTALTCTACTGDCATCSGSVSTCTSCSGGKFLYNSACYTSCDDTLTSVSQATYTSGTNCIACPASCKTCSGSSTCTSCDTTNLEAGSCVATCTTGSIPISQVCTACTSPWATCNTAITTCTSCVSASPYLVNNAWLASCSSGYLTVDSSNPKTCTACTTPCASCSGTVTTCTACSGSYSLLGTACTLDCGTGYVSISSVCTAWGGGCKTCSSSTTYCTSCTSPQLLHSNTCVSSCPSGYEANSTTSTCQLTTTTTTNTTTNSTTSTNTTTTTTTVTNTDDNFSLIYFPFLVVALFLFIISVVGWAKDPRSLIPTTFLALLAIVEWVFYLVQIYLAYDAKEDNIFYLTGLAFAGLYVCNLLTGVIFWWLSWRDQNFKYWKNSYCKTKWFIQIISLFISFKFLKLLYSSFFGLEHFFASWTKIKRFVNFMIWMSLLNIVTSIIPCVLADALGIWKLSWGTQLYITLIETAFLELLMVFFLLVEICTTRNIDKRDQYSKIDIEPNMSMLDNKLDESNEDDKLRANALKRLIDMMHKDEFSHDGDGPKRTRSLPADGNELDEISERANSYPLSPRTKKEMEDQLINPLALGFYRPDEAWEPQDNVYAESKPPDPFGKIGKTYKDGDTQTFMVGGDHDIPFRVDDNDDGRHPRTKGRVGRGRGKRSRFEEKIREENQFLDQDSDELDEDGELDVIKEEEDLIAAGIISGRKKEEDEEAERKRLEDDLRKKIEEEDNQLLEEEKRLATNKTEDDFIKEAEEELSKSKLDSASLPPHQSEKSELNDTEVNVNPVTVNSAAKNIDGMRIPPSHDKRTFNENDVKGELDRNEEGKYSPAVLPTGVMVDKYGRKVNEKGYLVDDDGNVIDCKTEKQMFEKDKLDPSGDIPQPFKLERYNFNPHDITGDFGFDRNDKPALNETPDGKLVDNSGRQVNEKGILVDEEGNVIDKYRRKKLDKDQLTNQGDLPMMLNYNGKQFKMQDVMGQFDKDPRGDIILEKDANGNMVDKKGRRVNDKGYLVDENGNIIDKKGNKVWDKDHLFENEFPKIFPFSTFNPETITGNFKRDKNGKPILKPADKEGQFYDDDGNLVNKQGYLINKDGDIIDKNGNLVFKKNILKDGEIPPVFRNGMIRQNSSTSLSRLMSEIDKNQDSDLDILKNQLEDFEEDKGNTSVDSLMEDTPSNYNIANQRFDERKYKKEPDAKYDEDEEDYYDEGDENEYEGEEDEDEDEEDNDSITGPAGVPILNARQPKSKILRKKKKKKRRKKKPKLEYEDPTAADKAMARAYGGAARGRMVRKPKRLKSGRSTSSHASRGFSKPARRDQFFHKAGGSVSGRDPSMKINTIRSDHSKGRVGKGPSLPSKAGTKKKTRGPISKASHSDFEKLYDKNLDDFLENSEFDFESIGPPSRTMSRQGSVRGDNRLKGLESIYLQRLEANPAKGKGKKGGKKRRGKKGDNDFLGSEISDQDDLAGLIEDNYRKMKNKFAPQSARGKKRNNAPDYNQPNIFTGNYTKYVKGSNGGDMDQL